MGTRFAQGCDVFGSEASGGECFGSDVYVGMEDEWNPLAKGVRVCVRVCVWK